VSITMQQGSAYVGGPRKSTKKQPITRAFKLVRPAATKTPVACRHAGKGSTPQRKRLWVVGPSKHCVATADPAAFTAQRWGETAPVHARAFGAASRI
jgi:hypothetical protein